MTAPTARCRRWPATRRSTSTRSSPAAIGEGLLTVQQPDVAERLRAAGTRRWEAYDPAAIRRTVVATLAELAGR